MPALSWLSGDGLRILAARAVRSFAYGMLAVLLGIYLKEQGFSNLETGAVFSLAIVGGAIATLIASFVADRVGRRRFLVATGVLMAGAGVIFAVGEGFPLLAAAAVIGTVSPTATEVGPFLSLEQAILPQTCPRERRTFVFALYNLLGSIAAAFGALFSGLPPGLEAAFGLDTLFSLRVMFVVYAGLAVAATLLFTALSPEVEVTAVTAAPSTGLRRSRGKVAGLALLFGVDSFAGGFVIQSIVALWFFEKFGLPLETLGTIFFVSGVLSAASFLVAARLADRIGLLNTMVFTHLPSNVLLMLVPVAPTLPLALAFYLGRMSLSQMDVPTRQAYTVALVAPEERTAAAGATNMSRTVTQAVSPSLAGYVMGAFSLSVPFFIGGGLKILYDLALYAVFRRVELQEEAPSPEMARRDST
ncbi:MAG: MFS transporter [Chloroflexi bacterium]|nr:MFS transporter [Chloroflexota bacterium]